ncbi:hypothetical protein RhiirB3_155957 [Rhizophagus irregularis]|nr:hypothetical protein RhiirB3_155957 [Rhizophagus irregularis]
MMMDVEEALWQVLGHFEENFVVHQALHLGPYCSLLRTFSVKFSQHGNVGIPPLQV